MRKTKAQINCALTAKLISAFVFAAYIVYSFYFLYPKFHASTTHIICDRTARLMSELVGNPEDRFSRDAAHISRFPVTSASVIAVLDIKREDPLNRVMRKPVFLCMRKQRRRSAAQLTIAFVFGTWIVQSLNFINPKFQASRHLLCLRTCSSICVGPGRKL